MGLITKIMLMSCTMAFLVFVFLKCISKNLSFHLRAEVSYN